MQSAEFLLKSLLQTSILAFLPLFAVFHFEYLSSLPSTARFLCSTTFNFLRIFLRSTNHFMSSSMSLSSESKSSDSLKIVPIYFARLLSFIDRDFSSLRIAMTVSFSPLNSHPSFRNLRSLICSLAEIYSRSSSTAVSF